MKIFTSTQIKELDRYTIEHEPIPSIDLMERAAKTLTRAITDTWNNSVPVIVFAGYKATTAVMPWRLPACWGMGLSGDGLSL